MVQMSMNWSRWSANVAKSSLQPKYVGFLPVKTFKGACEEKFVELKRGNLTENFTEFQSVKLISLYGTRVRSYLKARSYTNNLDHFSMNIPK